MAGNACDTWHRGEGPLRDGHQKIRSSPCLSASHTIVWHMCRICVCMRLYLQFVRMRVYRMRVHAFAGNYCYISYSYASAMEHGDVEAGAWYVYAGAERRSTVYRER